MTIKAATPYLMVHGQAEQAIAHYGEALGATVETLMRFGDVDQSCPAAQKSLVMHSVLRVGQAVLMLSDSSEKKEPVPGDTVSVALDFSDANKAHRSFEALAAGGRVIEPLMQAPWGALFGALVDKFGVSWMFNCDLKGS